MPRCLQSSRSRLGVCMALMLVASACGSGQLAPLTGTKTGGNGTDTTKTPVPTYRLRMGWNAACIVVGTSLKNTVTVEQQQADQSWVAVDVSAAQWQSANPAIVTISGGATVLGAQATIGAAAIGMTTVTVTSHGLTMGARVGGAARVATGMPSCPGLLG